VAVAFAIVIGALLVSFGVVQAMQLRRITRERDRANRVSAFMTNMFKLSDPTEVHASNVSTRDVLDKASKDIETSLSGDPEMQGQLMRVMGNAYKNMGVNDRAESLLEQAVQVDRRSFGPSNAETLAAMTNLAWTLNQEGRIPEAEKLQRPRLISVFRSAALLAPKNWSAKRLPHNGACWGLKTPTLSPIWTISRLR
jgi:eukaryotic-like serine/threonine-protein kinase